jgi:hypothetical protein
MVCVCVTLTRKYRSRKIFKSLHIEINIIGKSKNGYMDMFGPNI